MDTLYVVISRFKAGPNGEVFPNYGDLEAKDLPEGSSPELIEFRDAYLEVASAVAKEGSAIYFVRHNDPESRNFITLSAYATKAEFDAMIERTEHIFLRMRTARRALAVSLGVQVEIIEATVPFDEVLNTETYAAINKMFEGMPDDRIHTRSAPTIVT